MKYRYCYKQISTIISVTFFFLGRKLTCSQHFPGCDLRGIVIALRQPSLEDGKSRSFTVLTSRIRLPLLVITWDSGLALDSLRTICVFSKNAKLNPLAVFELMVGNFTNSHTFRNKMHRLGQLHLRSLGFLAVRLCFFEENFKNFE